MKKKTIKKWSGKKELKQPKEPQHEYICDKCGKPATYNLQDWWHLYEIKKSGDFREVNDWEADTNEFFCDDCVEN